MKAGQGFARRVTLVNLKSFARLLAPPGQNKKRGAESTADGNSMDDPETNAAEKLFSGVSVKSKHLFKPSPKSTSQKQQSGQAAPVVVSPVPATVPEILFAEIPRGSGRWSQANFDKYNFTHFFRADTGGPLKLWQVDQDGHVAKQPEVRPGVVVKSRNFRLELAAAADLNYPANGKPISVFAPVAPKEFLYMLLLPGSPHYKNAKNILTRHARSQPGRMKRVRVDSTTARAEWPDSPLWIAYASRPSGPAGN